MKQSVRLIAAVCALLLLAWGGHRWSADHAATATAEGAAVEWVDGLGVGFEPPGVALVDAGANVGLLLLGSWLFGMLFAKVGLPKITGFLGFGVLVGPSVLGLVTEESRGLLLFVNDLAIALIALSAGAELRIAELRGSFRAVAVLTLAMFAGVAAVVFGGAMLVVGSLEGVGGAGETPVWVVALLAVPILVASSPAVLMALMSELGARGPMMRLALAVTVSKDLLLVVFFAVVMAVMGGVLAVGAGGASDTGGNALFATLVTQVPGSLVGGVVVGLAMVWYLRVIGAHLPIFVVLSCFGIALVSQVLGFDALIVGLVAGVLMENAYPKRSATLFDAVEELSLPVYCVFFAVAGAKLNLRAAVEMWPMALGMVAVRSVAVVVMAWVGCRVSGMGAGFRRWYWSSFIAQAGVALALASIIERAFEADHEWASGFFTLMLATIAVHEFVGPALCKIGLKRSGDLDAPVGPEEPGEPARASVGDPGDDADR